MQKIIVKISVVKLPARYTCDGDNVSPYIGLDGVSADVKAMAVLMLGEAECACGNQVYWSMWNIDPATMIPENIEKEPVIHFPFEAVQGENTYGSIGYHGPCPSAGATERYEIRVYGLSSLLDVPPGADFDTLREAMSGNVIAFGSTFVAYGR